MGGKAESVYISKVDRTRCRRRKYAKTAIHRHYSSSYSLTLHPTGQASGPPYVTEKASPAFPTRKANGTAACEKIHFLVHFLQFIMPRTQGNRGMGTVDFGFEFGAFGDEEEEVVEGLCI